MPPRKTASPPLPATYGEAVAQLEQIVSGLESGQLPLEDLLGQYQRGAQLLAFCRERLQAVPPITASAASTEQPSAQSNAVCAVLPIFVPCLAPGCYPKRFQSAFGGIQ